MMAMLSGVASGWLATLFLCLAALIGVLGRARRGRLRAFGLHFGFGLLVPATALAHASFVMTTGGMRLMNPAGLWLATAALGLATVQAALGFALRASTGPERLMLRPLHVTIMFVLVATIGAHAWLNRV